MGAWGTGIFSSDDACDVRCEYNAIIGSGVDDETALKAMKKFFQIKNDVCEEEADFWYALAALQLRYGRLCDEVKSNAIECIENGYTTSQELWFEPKDSIKRIKVLGKLKSDIILYNPGSVQRKKPKFKAVKALGKVGDVLCYHLINYSVESENAYWKKLFEIHHVDANGFQIEHAPWYIGKYILLYISRVESEPISKAMPELPSNEYTYCMMYDWMGNVMPDVSMTKELKLTDYKIIPQKSGDVRRCWEMTYEPHSKIRMRKEKYLFNIGPAVNTSVLPFDNSAQAVFDMESELDSLFKLNPDIESRFKSYLD